MFQSCAECFNRGICGLWGTGAGGQGAGNKELQLHGEVRKCFLEEVI